MRSEKLILIILLCSGIAWGQASGGFAAVGGTVRDSNGEGIPDTTVALSNAALGTQYTMNTTDDGVFYAPTVVPFTGYRLKVTRKDFASWESSEFVVSTGQRLEFEITLESSENDSHAQSHGGLRPVDEFKSGLGATLSPLEVSETPAGSRKVDTLVPLAPAVASANSIPGVWVFHGWPFSNLFLTDGLLTANTYFAEKPGLANQLSETAVQDFHIASANFSGEFGGTMGGIVDAASRSGTTAYHGELYEFFRNRSLQAEDRYALGYNTRQLQHLGGINVGGPIRPDKLFFFFNAEALDRSAQGLNRIMNPLIADSSGTHVLASNCQATAAQCAVATRFLQSQMNVLVTSWEHSYRGLAKLDYRRSERNSFSFDANALEWHAPSHAETESVAPNGGLLGDPVIREKTRFAKAGWAATGSNQAANDLRIGWFQDRIAEYPSPAGLRTGLVGISIAGTIVGQSQPFTSILPSEHRLQLIDNGNFTLGSHSIKAGVEFDRTRDYLYSLDNAAGWYSYPSVTTFAQDFAGTGLRTYTSFSQTLGNPDRRLHRRYFAVYAEDTYRLSRRLTVDYALRYERPKFPQPPQANSTYYQTGIINAPGKNFSPRIGFAFLINDRTALRGGYGWYYGPYPGQLIDTVFLGNAISQTSISVNPNQPGAPVFPNIFQSNTALPTGTTNIAYIQPNLRNEYLQEASLALERRISSGTSISLSVLHTRGFKLWTTQDANLVAPTQSVTYTILNNVGQPAGTYTTQLWTQKGNGNFAHVYQIENGGSSWYNAAVLQVHKRMSHGFSVDASYAWSHAIDNLGQTAPFGVGFASTFNTLYTADKGNSQFDQRHRAAIQWLWQPVFTTSNSTAARYLINGWQLATFTTLGSSRFATPIAFIEGQPFSNMTMAYTSSLTGSGGWARVPFLPIGSLKTGPQYNVDARLARSIPITERIQARLMIEALNVFNMQYDTRVNTIAYLAQRPGVLEPVPGLGQGNASQGFPDGTNARRVDLALRIVF